MLNIIFMGTPDFARDSLEEIYKKGHKILAVVTTPDKPKGRGMKMIPTPVKEYAIFNDLDVYQPETIKNNTEFIKTLEDLKPDVICVVSYGKVLPREVLEIPKYGCINVHPSMLPKYRGSTPIQTAILNGDTKTGVTTMYMEETLDSGDIILQEEVDIGENETTGELWDRLSKLGASLLSKTLEQIENGTVNRKKQGDNYTVTKMLSKEMSYIDWENQSAKEIKNLVRALNPIMGAYSFLNGKKIKFWKVDVVLIDEFIEKFSDFKQYKKRLEEVTSGAVIYVDEKCGLYIKAKDDIIIVKEIQGENAKRMSMGDFLRGNKIQVAEIFE